MKSPWQLLLQVHIYLGLFCIPLFLVFALSSLDFNHRFISEQPLREPAVEQLTMAPQKWHGRDLRSYGEGLRDSLGIFGWYIPWASRSDSLTARVKIEGPMREYLVDVAVSGEAKLTTSTKSLAHLLKIVHFLGEDVPNAPWWLSGWKYYQRISVYAMLFWVISGLMLWWRRRGRPTLEGRVLWLGLSLTTLLIMIVWLVK